MGDVPFPREEEPTDAERAEGIVRNAIAGSPQGMVRRTILYTVVAVALLSGSVFGLFASGVGLIALLLLAMSDQLA